MHDKRIFSSFNELHIAGADPGVFRARVGGDATGKLAHLDTPPAARMSRIWAIGVWGGAPAASQLLHF